MLDPKLGVRSDQKWGVEGGEGAGLDPNWWGGEGGAFLTDILLVYFILHLNTGISMADTYNPYVKQFTSSATEIKTFRARSCHPYVRLNSVFLICQIIVLISSSKILLRLGRVSDFGPL